MLAVQVIELWGRILKIVRGRTALRDLIHLVEVAIEHAPATEHEGAVKEALREWVRLMLPWLQPFDPKKVAAEGTLLAVEYQLLCCNRTGVVSLHSLLCFAAVSALGCASGMVTSCLVLSETFEWWVGGDSGQQLCC